MSSDDVTSAISDDPDAIAAQLSGHLDYEDIQQNLDPDPADVQSSMEDLSGRFDELCSGLSLAEALQDEVISC